MIKSERENGKMLFKNANKTNKQRMHMVLCEKGRKGIETRVFKGHLSYIKVMLYTGKVL